MQFRHSDKAKDLNHSICSFHKPCEWNKQLPFPMWGWQKCLWLAKNPAVGFVHSSPSSTRAWTYYRFYFDHSWTLLHEQGFHVFLSFFVCAFVKKGTAITGKGRNTPKERMISPCFPPFSKQISITCCHLQFKELLKKTTYQSGGKERKSGVVFFSFITISLLWYIRPDPPRQFTWISVLFWSFISPSFMSPSATHCPHREVYQAGTGGEQSRHGSGTGLKEPSCDLREVP